MYKKGGSLSMEIGRKITTLQKVWKNPMTGSASFRRVDAQASNFFTVSKEFLSHFQLSCFLIGLGIMIPIA
jgi:hypothetical protein